MVNTETHLVMKLALEEQIHVIAGPAGGSYLEAHCPTILESVLTKKQPRPHLQEQMASSLQIFKDLLVGQVNVAWIPVNHVAPTPTQSDAFVTSVPFEVTGRYVIPIARTGPPTSCRRGLFRFGRGSAASSNSVAAPVPNIEDIQDDDDMEMALALSLSMSQVLATDETQDSHIKECIKEEQNIEREAKRDAVVAAGAIVIEDSPARRTADDDDLYT